MDNENHLKLLEKIESFLEEQVQSEELLSRIVIKNGATISIVKVNDIQWIEASGNYVKVVTADKNHLLRSTLSGIAQKLDPDQFFRIHKSTVLNISYVERLEEMAYGDYKVFMSRGDSLKMSRNFKDLLRSA